MITNLRSVEALTLRIAILDSELTRFDITIEEKMKAEEMRRFFLAAVEIAETGVALDIEKLIESSEEKAERVWSQFLNQSTDLKVQNVLRKADETDKLDLTAGFEKFLLKWKKRFLTFKDRDQATPISAVVNSFVSHSRAEDCQKINEETVILFKVGRAIVKPGAEVIVPSAILKILVDIDSRFTMSLLKHSLLKAQSMKEDPAARGREMISTQLKGLHITLVPVLNSPYEYQINLGFDAETLGQLIQNVEIAEADKYHFE
jgi:hypothetical protein